VGEANLGLGGAAWLAAPTQPLVLSLRPARDV